MVGLRSAFPLLVLMIFVSWVEGESEILLSCSDLGGDCVPKENNTCSIQVESIGCDKHEICCKFQRQAVPQVCNETSLVENCMTQDYNGVCQSKCTFRRVEVGACAGGCKCCGCQPKCICIWRHGYCTEDSSTCVGTVKDNWCYGDKCHCCVPDCPVTLQCQLAGGRCAKSCGTDEEAHSTIECIKENDDNCRCCVPKPKPDPCPTTKWCRFFRGECKEDCHHKSQIGDHRFFSFCGTGGCKCCRRSHFHG